MKRQWNILISESWLDDMENSGIFKTMKRQWNILITRSWLDDMENSGIFKTMKKQWNILITWSWLDGMENCGIFKTMKRQWNIFITESCWHGKQWDFQNTEKTIIKHSHHLIVTGYGTRDIYLIGLWLVWSLYVVEFSVIGYQKYTFWPQEDLLLLGCQPLQVRTLVFKLTRK
jgi:hypothetical protein